MKNNQPRPTRATPRRNARKDTLIQTRVPTANAKALRLTAQAAGTTLAGYVRKMIMDTTSVTSIIDMEIPKEEPYIVDVDFAFSDNRDDEDRSIEPGDYKTFTARIPYTFRLDAIVFEDEYIIRGLYIGNKNAFPVILPMEIPTTDYPEKRLNLSHKICGGMSIVIDISADKKCSFKARLIGKRPTPRTRPSIEKTKKATAAAINVGGELVAPGEIKEFRARCYSTFQCDRIVVDNHEAFVLNTVEVCRIQQIEKPKQLDHSTPLQLAYVHPGEEIRLFVQNTSKSEMMFKARLHGLAVI